MKTVPSLVASSTVGIAAAGLALGKPELLPPSPASKERKATGTADIENHEHFTLPLVSRSGTSSTIITPENKIIPQKNGSSSGPYPPQAFYNRPSNARLDSLNNSGGTRASLSRDSLNNSIGKRSSMIRPEEPIASGENTGEVARRDSVSSRGSWIRRFSAIPLSSSNSPRSSLAPDTASQILSHGSNIPILAELSNQPSQLPPNKLVKRTPSNRAASGELPRHRSDTRVPTLRRPATSHQRSATLQQRFQEDAVRKEHLQRSPSLQAMQATTPNKVNAPNVSTAWRPFFESRPTKLTKERSPRLNGGLQASFSSAKRVLLEETSKATLVKADMLILVATVEGQCRDEDILANGRLQANEENTPDRGLDALGGMKGAKRAARRSFSMNFSTPVSWVSREGSLRGRGNLTELNDTKKRISSVPVLSLLGHRLQTTKNTHRNITDPTVFQNLTPANIKEPSIDPFISAGFKPRSRNSSSPLPPQSQSSSSKLDTCRNGHAPPSSSVHPPTAQLQNPNPRTPSEISISPLLPSAPVNGPSSYHRITAKSPRTSDLTERASTLVDSDNEMKGCVSGDDDDLDFPSETVFDSLRSGGTGSVRSHNAPLEAMFDESPPSLNGHAKSTRLSIHGLMNNGGFGEGNKIMEEDENTSTPVRSACVSPEDRLQTPVRRIVDVDIHAVHPSPPNFSLATNNFGRLSLEMEDEDEDWTRDNENDLSNSLSPPNSSLNSQKVSPAFRAALADVTHTDSTKGMSNSERPRSTIFDWAESSVEKSDSLGNTARPKTAQQNSDGRGGRTSGRRGPSAMHIRSQSVPVVPDPAGQREATKLAPKFGTWGLGAKGVSEDWDNDFDFDLSGTDDPEGREEDILMRVPPAIKAAQATVVGHVGQIREVCLLVDDLKRLRNLAREKGLLDGSSAPLWKEADGIIALAVPDEEESTLSPPHSPSSSFSEDDEEYVNTRYIDHGPDVSEICRPSAPFEVLNRHGRPTGFVYDGNTVRRRSVFSPDDNIFGEGAVINNPPIREGLRPPQTTPRHSSAKTSDVARSVMETMHQHRATSDPLLSVFSNQRVNKMPFDTTSLRDLVHRASMLSRTLADIIRKSEDSTNSPDCNAHRDREASPAFTRVFTDPMAKAPSPNHLSRAHSNNSILSGSMDASPSRNLGQRMQMMTVV